MGVRRCASHEAEIETTARHFEVLDCVQLGISLF